MNPLGEGYLLHHKFDKTTVTLTLPHPYVSLYLLGLQVPVSSADFVQRWVESAIVNPPLPSWYDAMQIVCLPFKEMFFFEPFCFS
jgi:hypothetical protein